jgi:hypothetical protein
MFFPFSPRHHFFVTLTHALQAFHDMQFSRIMGQKFPRQTARQLTMWTTLVQEGKNRKQKRLYFHKFSCFPPPSK